MPRVEGFNYGVYPGIPQGIETVSLSDDLTYEGVKAFMVDADGTLAVTMVDETSGTMVVKAGIQYAGDVKIFKSTGSSDVTSVSILY